MWGRSSNQFDTGGILDGIFAQNELALLSRFVDLVFDDGIYVYMLGAIREGMTAKAHRKAINCAIADLQSAIDCDDDCRPRDLQSIYQAAPSLMYLAKVLSIVREQYPELRFPGDIIPQQVLLDRCLYQFYTGLGTQL